MPGRGRGSLEAVGRELLRAWPLLDKRFYVVWVAACVAYVASVFISAMLTQTGGELSAPLDDVFIHFDYARSLGRGYPFYWTRESGYSSGNTSPLYLVALAFGWIGGFRGTSLMAWAIVVACASLVAFFVAVARATEPLGSWAKYLCPPAVLSVGALDWSLFSGMENAFHLGVWGLATLALERFSIHAKAASRLGGPVGLLSAALGALVLTRPESVVCVVVYAVTAMWLARGRGLRRVAAVGAIASGGPFLTLAGLATVNRLFTGEWAQAGAIAKLALYDPYATPNEKLADWAGNLKHVLLTGFGHHLGDRKWVALLVATSALVPLVARSTRGRAAIAWAQIVGWVLLVSLNGQVRWQNERYVMSAVAWLLALAGLGIAVLVSHHGDTLRARFAWGGRLALAGIMVVLYWQHQRPHMRDQIWFFARASRNIRDQQLSTGLRFSDLKPRRILVGDAGAIIYGSDRPGLDLVGLGGYQKLPFARAHRHGLGASIELIERMEDEQRPDYMAIYPDWWGELPNVFGHYVAEVPVVGNVICAGPAKVIYRADWSSLEQQGRPRGLGEGERVVDELDIADLVSERAAGYRFPSPNMGRVVWRVLADPDNKNRDLFDAGREIPQGERESFELEMPASLGKLIVRTVTTEPSELRVVVAGGEVGRLVLEPSSGWREPSIDLPAGLPKRARVELIAERGSWVDYHVWVIGPQL
ncbi:MAG: hypothetical protein JNK04_23130 [Myxococcales bacterium]|nr:hypothetical protein [Myxococcales bacterium]